MQIISLLTLLFICIKLGYTNVFILFFSFTSHYDLFSPSLFHSMFLFELITSLHIK